MTCGLLLCAIVSAVCGWFLGFIVGWHQGCAARVGGALRGLTQIDDPHAYRAPNAPSGVSQGGRAE